MVADQDAYFDRWLKTRENALPPVGMQSYSNRAARRKVLQPLVSRPKRMPVTKLAPDHGGGQCQRLPRFGEAMTFVSSWTARTLSAVRQVPTSRPAGSEGEDALD